MGRYLSDQSKVVILLESGTYAAPTATGQWPGQVQSHNIIESQNKEIIAPGDGIVTHISSVSGANDGVCLDLTDGRALKIFHLTPTSRWSHDTTIQKGQVLGRLAGPNGYNGNYAHIHIQAHETDCAGILRSFTETYGFRFEYHPNLPYNEIWNQYSGVKLSNSAATRGAIGARSRYASAAQPRAARGSEVRATCTRCKRRTCSARRAA